MVFIDTLGIFYAPDSPYNLYRVDGTWYYHYDQKWYKSHRHDGSWRYVSYSNLPDALQRLPERYIKKKNPPPEPESRASKGKKKKASGPKKKRESSSKKSLSYRYVAPPHTPAPCPPACRWCKVTQGDESQREKMSAVNFRARTYFKTAPFWSMAEVA